MKYLSLTGKTQENIIDPDFRLYDSISVSPERYDPNIPLQIYGDPIVKALSSPISAVLPGDYLAESSIIES